MCTKKMIVIFNRMGLFLGKMKVLLFPVLQRKVFVPVSVSGTCHRGNLELALFPLIPRRRMYCSYVWNILTIKCCVIGPNYQMKKYHTLQRRKQGPVISHFVVLLTRWLTGVTAEVPPHRAGVDTETQMKLLDLVGSSPSHCHHQGNKPAKRRWKISFSNKHINLFKN